MSEWTVVLVIIALFGLVTSVVKPIVKLNTNLTEQSAAIKVLSDAVKSLLSYVDKNDGCHKEFTEQLNDHETRITVIEVTRNGVDK